LALAYETVLRRLELGDSCGDVFALLGKTFLPFILPGHAISCSKRITGAMSSLE
jgi:hypothetical protein